MLLALPRIDAVTDAGSLATAYQELVRAVRTAWEGPVAPAVRTLPERLELAALDVSGRPEGSRVVAIGVNIDVGVGYEADIDHVEKVINTVGKKLAEDENWKMHIFEPMQFLRVDAFDDSSVRIKALGKVEPAMQWAVAGEYRRRLKKAFEKESIEIPFNQVVVRKAKQ